MNTLQRFIIACLAVLGAYFLVNYLFAPDIFTILYVFIKYGLLFAIVILLFFIPKKPLYGITNKVAIVFLCGFFTMATFIATGFLSPLLYTLSLDGKTQNDRSQEFFLNYVSAMEEGNTQTAARVIEVYKNKNFQTKFNDSGFKLETAVSDSTKTDLQTESFLQKYSLSEFDNLHQDQLLHLIENLYTDKQFFSALFLISLAKYENFDSEGIERLETKILKSLVLPVDSREKELELYLLRQLNAIIPDLIQANRDEKKIIANYYSLTALRRNVGNYDFDWLIDRYEQYLEEFIFYTDDTLIAFLEQDIPKPILFSSYQGGNITVVFFANDTAHTRKGVFYKNLTILVYDFSENHVLGEYSLDYAYLRDGMLYTKAIRRIDGIVENEGQTISHTRESIIPDVEENWVIPLGQAFAENTIYSVINDNYYRTMTFDQVLTHLSVDGLENHALVNLYNAISQQAILPFLVFFCLVSCSLQWLHRGSLSKKMRYLGIIATVLAIKFIHVFIIITMPSIIGFHVYTNSEAYLFSITTSIVMIVTLLTIHNLYKKTQ